MLDMIKPFRTHHLCLALEKFEQQTLPLDHFLNLYYRGNKALGSKDRLFIGDAIYSIIRWKGLIDACSPRPITAESRVDTFLSNTLDDLRKKAITAHDQVSFPEWLHTNLIKNYGKEKANELCLSLNKQAPAVIRTNLLKTNRTALLETLKKLGNVEITNLSPYGITFLERVNYFEIPEFNLGHFENQDEGSQLLADLIDSKPEDQVMDFCSGSGGKTLAFAHKMKGKGQIYLHDVRKTALAQAKKRLNRAGVQNAQIVPSGDARLKKLKKKMQWVFVDAPCSGTGTFRRNPDMKWKLKPETVERLVGEQRKIFEQALSYLDPKGSIIYATCSILPEENEQQTAHFIKTYGLEIVGIPLQILPQDNGPDGFYGVVLRRVNQEAS